MSDYLATGDGPTLITHQALELPADAIPDPALDDVVVPFTNPTDPTGPDLTMHIEGLPECLTPPPTPRRHTQTLEPH